MKRTFFATFLAAALTLCVSGTGSLPGPAQAVAEVNTVSGSPSSQLLVIAGATLIDGRGGPAIPDSILVVKGTRILAAGPRRTTAIPSGAEVVCADGLSLLPGLLDSHFHLEAPDLPALYLQHGVTSVRDPGQWIEAYEAARQSGTPIPRLFLAGPHLDSPPPAYPADSYLVRDPVETRDAVNRFIDSGASVIKVYFRLPLGLIQTAVSTAHARGVPVTAHLEIVDARDAIRAGLDGVEHVTSFGTALLPPREAERYRQDVLKDNDARREGRYRVWSEIDLESPRCRELLELLVRRRVFVSPTLAVFERRAGDPNTTDMHVGAFRNMLAFVGEAKRAGAKIVVGSHAMVPHAEKGWAYQREMELLVEAGLTPLEAITAGTLDNARFFRVSSRLGSLEPGKTADLILVAGNPSIDISAMRKVRGVMQNGRWVRALGGEGLGIK
jgi:imidazolonepropionase-like amidohydrolase